MTQPAAMPRVVHLQPGESIQWLCTCRPICSGQLADDPDCQMHHGQPTTYIITLQA